MICEFQSSDNQLHGVVGAIGVPPDEELPETAKRRLRKHQVNSSKDDECCKVCSPSQDSCDEWSTGLHTCNKKKKSSKKFTKMIEMNKVLHEAKTYENKNKFEALRRAAEDCRVGTPGYSVSTAEAAGTQKWKQDEKILMLRKVPEGTIGQVDKPQWKRVSLAADSGACETVGDPSQIPCKVNETEESKRGACFASATGEAIPNMGEMMMPMYTREGSFRSMKVQAAPVTKPLASVRRIVQAGHIVVFDAAGSYIMNKESGEVNMLREEEGNYMLDVWVPPVADENAGFPRQSEQNRNMV